MKFHQYHFSQELLDRLEELGFKKPTDIQYKAITPILKGEDVLGIAQTGTGKTAAFAIPLIELLSNTAEYASSGPRCLVMVPTRELAQQIADVFDSISKYLAIRTVAIIGGVTQKEQIHGLKKADVVVSTPGRFFDLHHQGHLNLSEIKALVVDEADRMLEFGFFKDIKDVVRLLSKDRQTLFFSATINDQIKKLAYAIVRNAIRIQLSPKDPVTKKVSHFVAHIDMDHKRFYLERLIKERADQKIMVFVRTKVRADRVEKAMGRVGISTLVMHGDKDQKDRQRALDLFKSGDQKILIATDVSARGIDVERVDLVINYDLPDNGETYVHRIGRTGRGTHSGEAISFCSEEEKEKLQLIEDFLSKPVEALKVDKSTHEDTLMMAEDDENDWKSVMKKIAEFEDEQKARRKKKKNR